MRPPCWQQPSSCVVHNPRDRANKTVKRARYQSHGMRQIFELLLRKAHLLKTCNDQRSGLSSLPTEILLIICKFLPLESQASLAFSCASLKQRLGPQFWPYLNSAANSQAKINFLRLLQTEIPKSIVCSQCLLLHYPPPFRLGWPGSYKFEPFYILTRTQISAAVNGSLCTEYLTCAAVREIPLQHNRPTAGVWCRPRIVNGHFLLNRQWVFPLLPFSGWYPGCIEPLRLSDTDCILCDHVSLKYLADPSFGPLATGLEGIGWIYSGEITVIDAYEAGYRYSRRCETCGMEFYLLKREGETVICDIYHDLMDGKQRQGPERLKTHYYYDNRDSLRNIFEAAGSFRTSYSDERLEDLLLYHF